MSSLRMIGARRIMFDIKAQQNDCQILIDQINREERIKFAAKIAAGISVLMIVCWAFGVSLDREDKRMDIEIQSFQAQGYPVSR